MNIYACIIEANQPLCIGDSRRYYLGNFVFLLPTTFKLFEAQLVWLWWYMVKIIPIGYNHEYRNKKALIIHILLKSTKVWIKIWD